VAKITRADAVKLLGDVPEEFIFWCCDGRIFKNSRELYEGLSAMTNDSFAFHANAYKNDFSNWVRDVLKDNKLARDLLNANSHAQAAKTVAERMNFLSGKLA
jgi:hypothetical protein